MTNPQNEKEFIEAKMRGVWNDSDFGDAESAENWLREALSRAIHFGRTQREEELKYAAKEKWGLTTLYPEIKNWLQSQSKE